MVLLLLLVMLLRLCDGGGSGGLAVGRMEVPIASKEARARMMHHRRDGRDGTMFSLGSHHTVHRLAAVLIIVMTQPGSVASKLQVLVMRSLLLLLLLLNMVMVLLLLLLL